MGNPIWAGRRRVADVGIELGFFKDRLTFKASYYDKRPSTRSPTTIPFVGIHQL